MSLTVKGQVDYWLRLSMDSLLDMRAAMRSGRRTNALFCGHLAVEKMLKALCAVRCVPANQIWGHNLLSLAHKANCQLTNPQVLELGVITGFNLAARYDDHKRAFAKICSIEYARKWIIVIESWCKNLKQMIIAERSCLPNKTPAT